MEEKNKKQNKTHLLDVKLNVDGTVFTLKRLVALCLRIESCKKHRNRFVICRSDEFDTLGWTAVAGVGWTTVIGL